MAMLGLFNKNCVNVAAHDPKFPAPISSPRYPKQERGVCIIVGTHPCVNADVDAALAKYPNASICAVNEATALVPADHVATCHGEKIAHFLQMHEDVWDDVAYPLPVVHIRNAPEADGIRAPLYRWDMNYGGGSAIFAAGVMVEIGFDLVVLAGCPIDGGGGYALKTNAGTPHDPRLGFMHDGHTMVEAWQHSIRSLKENAPAVADKIRSMSGFTKEVFGGI